MLPGEGRGGKGLLELSLVLSGEGRERTAWGE